MVSTYASLIPMGLIDSCSGGGPDSARDTSLEPSVANPFRCGAEQGNIFSEQRLHFCVGQERRSGAHLESSAMEYLR